MEHVGRTLVIGAIVTVLLQVVVAPNISIFQIVPNFFVVFTLVAAMLIPSDAVIVAAFCLGLICDLLGYGPVGALALLLTLAAAIAQRAHAMFANDSVGVPLAILVVFALLVDVLYVAILAGMSSAISPLDAFLYRALPCALYDCVLGLVLYPLASRLLTGSQPQMRSVTPTPNSHLR